MDEILDLRPMDMCLGFRVAMDLREGHNFMACGQTHGPNLGFQGVGQGADLMNVMDPRKGKNLIICGQTYGPDLVFQGVG